MKLKMKITVVDAFQWIDIIFSIVKYDPNASKKWPKFFAIFLIYYPYTS